MPRRFGVVSSGVHQKRR